MNNTKGKAMFIHSHIFLYDKYNNVYSEGKLTYDTWERYLNHFETLTVLGRFKSIESTLAYNISSGNNVKHVKLPNLSVIKNRKLSVEKTKEILRNNIQDVEIVIARLPSIYGNLAIQIAKELKKPYVVELVGDVFSSLWFHGNILGKILAPISFYKTRRVIKEAPYVLYVTEKFLQQKYPSQRLKVTTSCSNVEIDKYFEVGKDKLMQNGRFTIGLIGSYASKYKGINNSLNVIKQLIDEGKNVEFRILGSGNSDWIINCAKKLGIEQYVKLDGSLPAGPDVFNWLSRLDLYIQPSLTEGLPRALIEAMYCHLPCVASNVGGIPELLPDSNLHDPKDEKKMYEVIKKMYEDEEYREMQALINHEKAISYTKEILDERRNTFFEEVLNDVRGKSI